MDHEAEFVRAFVDPDRRERWLELLVNPKKRRTITASLAHKAPFRVDRVVGIRPGDQHAPKIEDILRSKGAPSTCHVISEDRDLDGREMDLHDVLIEIVGHGMGTILSCVPGKLAFYEGESMKDRFILEAK